MIDATRFKLHDLVFIRGDIPRRPWRIIAVVVGESGPPVFNLHAYGGGTETRWVDDEARLEMARLVTGDQPTTPSN